MKKPNHTNKPGRPSNPNLYENVSIACQSLQIDAGRAAIAKVLCCPAFRPGGRVDGPMMKDWMAEHSSEIDAAMETAATLGSIEAAIKQEQHRKLKLANDQREGKLIPYSEHETELRALASSVQKAMFGLPATLAPDLAGLPVPEIEKRLQAAINEGVLSICKP